MSVVGHSTSRENEEDRLSALVKPQILLYPETNPVGLLAASKILQYGDISSILTFL